MIANRITTALLPLAMVLFAGSAAAEDRRTVKVSYAGLDLMSPAGSAEFERRIKRGVRSVCAEAGFDWRDVRAQRRCHETALAGARLEQQRVIAEARQLRRREVLASR